MPFETKKQRHKPRYTQVALDTNISTCRPFGHSLLCVLQQEFEAEQEYIKTLSYLSVEEQRKYKERQSVSFMYMKPPGMDSGVGKPKACKRCLLLHHHL